MKFEMRNPESLLAYENNSRTHSDEQIDQLVESIKNFGFNDPIEIGEDNVIISGHARALAARKAGLSSIPVVTLQGMNENARKAYIIAANKLALNAGWDVDILKIELGQLMSDDFNVELTGFSDAELNTLFATELTEPQLQAEEPKQAKTITCPNCGHIIND